ncbi:MAG: TonB-dependent receptor plug domain-containing protein [Gemmatimonadetes bacterium]|nr:TonB-dependent receptor plug domain-containing protein [Gemmatimonadota bacterium]
MKFSASLAAAALVLTAGSLAAQTQLLMGRVIDSVTSKAVSGGSVVVLGTALAATIRDDGSFALSVPIREITLRVSADGYKANEHRIRPADEVVQILLERDYFQQERAVTSGQATSVERKNLANSVAQINSEDLNRAPAQSMDQALKGKVTGADIQRSSSPGAAMSIRLRGITSILGNTTPLYIVDGVTVYSIDAINPNDIEDIQILKGASASAQYGSKASNGVVLIRTKRGGLSNRNR